MTSNNTPLDLDAIEARAQAATPGPWGVYQYGGDSLIEIAADLENTGTGYRARREICRLEDEPMDNDPKHREWTAEEDWAQVQADAAYIAAMSPEVAKALVDEVRRLRAENAELTEARRLEWVMSQTLTPHTPRICECGHSHHAHTVPAPHSCFAHGQTCECPAYRQMSHDDAVAHLERKQAGAAAARPSV